MVHKREKTKKNEEGHLRFLRTRVIITRGGNKKGDGHYRILLL